MADTLPVKNRICRFSVLNLIAIIALGHLPVDVYRTLYGTGLTGKRLAVLPVPSMSRFKNVTQSS